MSAGLYVPHKFLDFEMNRCMKRVRSFSVCGSNEKKRRTRVVNPKYVKRRTVNPRCKLSRFARLMDSDRLYRPINMDGCGNDFKDIAKICDSIMVFMTQRKYTLESRFLTINVFKRYAAKHRLDRTAMTHCARASMCLATKFVCDGVEGRWYDPARKRWKIDNIGHVVPDSKKTKDYEWKVFKANDLNLNDKTVYTHIHYYAKMLRLSHPLLTMCLQYAGKAIVVPRSCHYRPSVFAYAIVYRVMQLHYNDLSLLKRLASIPDKTIDDIIATTNKRIHALPKHEFIARFSHISLDEFKTPENPRLSPLDLTCKESLF